MPQSTIWSFNKFQQLLRLLLLIGFVLPYYFSYSQNQNDTIAIDSALWNFVNATPAELEKDIQELSQHLATPYEGEEQKAKAIYYWLIAHMEVKDENDVSFIYKPAHPEKILNQKSGTYYEISLLTKNMLEDAGLQASIIPGYIKEPTNPLDTLIRINYHWNTVRVAHNWVLMDVSMGAGAFQMKYSPLNALLYNTMRIPFVMHKVEFVPKPTAKYFNPPPLFFAQTHLPAHPMWQLSEYPISAKVFKQPKWDPEAQYRASEGTVSKPLDFLKAIRQFRQVSPVQQHFMHAQKASQFLPENFREKARGHGDYGLLKLEEIQQYVNSEPKTLIVRYRQVENHLGIAYEELKAEKKGLRSEHRDLLGINEQIHRDLKENLKAHSRHNEKVQRKIQSRVKQLGNLEKKTMEQIDAVQDDLRELDEEDILDVNRKRKGTAEANAEIAENNTTIDFLLEQVQKNRVDFDSIYESVLVSLQTQKENQNLMAANSTNIQDISEANISARIQNLQTLQGIVGPKHQEINSLFNLEAALRMENEFEENFVLKPERKLLETLLKEDSKHLKSACNLIKKNKKLSPADLDEDTMYGEQITSLRQENEEFIVLLEKRIEWNQNEFKLLKKEDKSIKKEQKLFKHEVAIDKKRMKAAKKRQEKRHKALIKEHKTYRSQVEKSLKDVTKKLKKLQASETED